MNRSRIEWCDHTWNPITGCRHGCGYCYARRMTARFSGDVRSNRMKADAYRTVPAKDGGQDIFILEEPMTGAAGGAIAYPFGFEPTFHRYRMDIPAKLKMGNNIFVGAMSDIFGAWVPDEWISEVLKACRENGIHNYLFLTKNPERYQQTELPDGQNMWYGTTVTDLADLDRLDHLPAERRTFISFEPLLEDLHPETGGDFFRQADWIIIGAQTGRTAGRTAPEAGWIGRLVREADRCGVPVFMKDSLAGIVGEENMRRDFPKQLKKSKISPKLMRKLYGKCCECGGLGKKSGMVSLAAKSARGEHAKQFCFMCRGCFKEFCAERNMELPELEAYSEKKDG